MSLHICFEDFDSWTDNISPFHIHPNTDKVHDLSEFGHSLIIKNLDSIDSLEEFLVGTSLFKADFTMQYIYYGQYLYTTEKQNEFKENIHIISNNIKNSDWNINVVVYTPK
jgi:hypothetical protein